MKFMPINKSKCAKPLENDSRRTQKILDSKLLIRYSQKTSSIILFSFLSLLVLFPLVFEFLDCNLFESLIKSLWTSSGFTPFLILSSASLKAKE